MAMSCLQLPLHSPSLEFQSLYPQVRCTLVVAILAPSVYDLDISCLVHIKLLVCRFRADQSVRFALRDATSVAPGLLHFLQFLYGVETWLTFPHPFYMSFGVILVELTFEKFYHRETCTSTFTAAL